MQPTCWAWPPTGRRRAMPGRRARATPRRRWPTWRLTCGRWMDRLMPPVLRPRPWTCLPSYRPRSGRRSRRGVWTTSSAPPSKASRQQKSPAPPGRPMTAMDAATERSPEPPRATTWPTLRTSRQPRPLHRAGSGFMMPAWLTRVPRTANPGTAAVSPSPRALAYGAGACAW